MPMKSYEILWNILYIPIISSSKSYIKNYQYLIVLLNISQMPRMFLASRCSWWCLLPGLRLGAVKLVGETEVGELQLWQCISYNWLYMALVIFFFQYWFLTAISGHVFYFWMLPTNWWPTLDVPKPVGDLRQNDPFVLLVIFGRSKRRFSKFLNGQLVIMLLCIQFPMILLVINNPMICYILVICYVFTISLFVNHWICQVYIYDYGPIPIDIF